MSLSDIRRRLAALEQPAKIVRFCTAQPTPEGCEFFGFRVTPFYLTDYRIEHLDPDEYFLVPGNDREECLERAHAMANERWLEHPLLVVVLRPLTEPTTPEVPPDEICH